MLKGDKSKFDREYEVKIISLLSGASATGTSR